MGHRTGLVRGGVGVDNVDHAYARLRGIPVANVPDYGSDETVGGVPYLVLEALPGETLGDYLRPAAGVYAVRAGVDRGLDTQWHDGVANFTTNLTATRRSGASSYGSGGTSGRLGERASVVTASAFSLPARMLGAAVARLSKLKSTCPDSSASCAGLPPL